MQRYAAQAAFVLKYVSLTELVIRLLDVLDNLAHILYTRMV